MLPISIAVSGALLMDLICNTRMSGAPALGLVVVAFFFVGGGRPAGCAWSGDGRLPVKSVIRLRSWRVTTAPTRRYLLEGVTFAVSVFPLAVQSVSGCFGTVVVLRPFRRRWHGCGAAAADRKSVV